MGGFRRAARSDESVLSSRRQAEAQGIRLSPRGAWMQRPREHTPTIPLIIKYNIRKIKKNPPFTTGQNGQHYAKGFGEKEQISVQDFRPFLPPKLSFLRSQILCSTPSNLPFLITQTFSLLRWNHKKTARDVAVTGGKENVFQITYKRTQSQRRECQ